MFGIKCCKTLALTRALLYTGHSSPVKELVWKGEHAYIGDGKIGPVTQKLYDTMTGMQWGKLPDTKGWIVPVE